MQVICKAQIAMGKCVAQSACSMPAARYDHSCTSRPCPPVPSPTCASFGVGSTMMVAPHSIFAAHTPCPDAHQILEQAVWERNQVAAEHGGSIIADCDHTGRACRLRQDSCMSAPCFAACCPSTKTPVRTAAMLHMTTDFFHARCALAQRLQQVRQCKVLCCRLFDSK